MIFFRRLLRLPTPVELGWSDHNALGSRDFTPYQEGKTWEDWREHCRKQYPVRYFLAEVLPLVIKMSLLWPMGRVRDWVLDHVVPSRRCHILDLRGVDPLVTYRHGYMDPCHVFWLAGWASLMRWNRESAEGKNPRQWMTPEMHADLGYQAQLQTYDEAIALVEYWTVTRIERDRRCSDLYRVVKTIAPTPENRERYEAATDEWLSYYRESESLEDSMFMRLVAIRCHLWD
jgi:hypothetical protein